MQPEAQATEAPPAVDVLPGLQPSAAPASALRRVFSFPVMLAFGLAVLAVLTVSNRFDDPDLWWHLKVGEFIWNTHSVPHSDIYSFTTNGHAWIAHEWLAELSIYTAYRLGGYSGLMLWLCGFAAALFIAAYGLCCLYSGNSRVAFLGGLIAWLFSTIGLAIRPLLPGHLLLVAELLLLELGRTRSRRWLWLLPPLFAVWVNCHGSYFFGLGVLAVHLGCSFLTVKRGVIACVPWDRRPRRLLAVVAALCVAALMINPIGPRLVLYPLDVLFNQRTNVSAVQEWFPPDLASVRPLGMLALLATVFLLAVARRRTIRLHELLVLAAATGMAFQHTRMLFLFGVVMAPIICRLLGSDYEQRGEDRPAANAFLIAASLAIMAGRFPSTAALQAQVTSANPSAAVEYIRRAGLTGPMLNEYQFGGYLIWALPQEKVFIDGRADVFDWTGVMSEYGRWTKLKDDPSALLRKYGIRLCLLSPQAPMARVMPYLPGWRKLYADSVAVVFVR